MLDSIKKDATELFLLGDLFDFWFEYKSVVPKGFVKVLAKLQELVEQGIKVHFFVGNHDLWMRDYFQKELGIQVYQQPEKFVFNHKKFLIGHGDGLGPGDTGYKFLKKIFVNPVLQWLYRWLHPDIGMAIARYLSLQNKYISGEADVAFLGAEKELLIQYCQAAYQKEHYDFFIFGHRHLPMEIPIGTQAQYINTGDWISYYTYAVFDGQDVTLATYPHPKKQKNE